MFANKPHNFNNLQRVLYTNNFEATGVENQILQIIFLEHFNITINGGSLMINNQIVSKSSLPLSNNMFDLIQATSDSLLIRGKDFTIIFDGLRVYITIGGVYLNKIIGLCGAFNLNTNDDFLAPNNIVEKNIITFTNYYKVNPNLPTPTQTNPCDQMISVSLFITDY